MDNVPFHISFEIQQAFEDVGHIYFRWPSYSPFINVANWVLDTSKAMSYIMISKIIEHYSTLMMMHKQSLQTWYKVK
jgi:hypothetical protein